MGGDPPPIRQLTSADLRQALVLSTAAGWNQQSQDWQMLLSLSAPATFAAVSGNLVVGTAMAIDYGGFAWIAMMLVDQRFRGQGLGTRLLEAALASVPPGRPVRLDATPAGRPLYRRYGFEGESTLTRFAVPCARALPLDELPATRAMTAADLQAVCSHDVAVFGGDRKRVLAWALPLAPQTARMLDRAGEPPQYSLGRPGRLFDQIGPVVATDDRGARALVSAALTPASGQSVVVDAFDSEVEFTGWLRASGFVAERPLYRMRRGPAGPATSDYAHAPASRQFAVFGPDFA